MTAWLLIVAGAATAQANGPRTPDGRPDFQGVWVNQFLPATERLPGATTLVVDDEKALALAKGFLERRKAGQPAVYDPEDDLGVLPLLPRVNGEWRTSLVTEPPDGKAPLTSEARAMLDQSRLDAMRNGLGLNQPDGPEALPLQERCLVGLGRAPLGLSLLPTFRRIVQTQDHLVIQTELSGDVRIVGIDKPRRDVALSSIMGDSVAHWEGDVLVIETINARAIQLVRGPGLVVGATAEVIERLSFISPNEILYRFTIVDAESYDRPWSAEYSLTRKDAYLLEGSCHEANYSLAYTLQGARMEEKR